MRTAYDAGVVKAASDMGMNDHIAELVGLGILAVPPARHMISRALGHDEDEGHIGPMVDAGLELTGLGVLAAPSLRHLLAKKGA
jgi:hypothetical protein